ncbi:RNA polymerase sigma factor SigZ [Parvicella tangerina]|uniref:RNA polymerase sigma factor n=1 Tax=Parvicella tangerina TaxID=2829795 RepID=A0A916JJI0_9FLAO|nr:RNA polymerase sigma factor SigZ [Parvicella tangerina]CAG5077861.1 ECF RNA polymerase sigma factor SigH [Parvicella tangerina]
MTQKNNHTIARSWDEFSEQLLGFIISRIHHKEDAEDILQEVYLKSINNIDKLQEDSNLNAWLYTVTRNAINDYFRNKQKNKETITQDIFTEDTDALNIKDSFCCLEPHINELPGKYKEVILLSEIEGLKHQEIADKLKLSLSAIKSRVVRGREMLKEKFVTCCKYRIDENGKLAGEPDCQRPECNH